MGLFFCASESWLLVLVLCSSSLSRYRYGRSSSNKYWNVLTTLLFISKPGIMISFGGCNVPSKLSIIPCKIAIQYTFFSGFPAPSSPGLEGPYKDSTGGIIPWSNNCKIKFNDVIFVVLVHFVVFGNDSDDQINMAASLIK